MILSKLIDAAVERNFSPREELLSEALSLKLSSTLSLVSSLVNIFHFPRCQKKKKGKIGVCSTLHGHLWLFDFIERLIGCWSLVAFCHGFWWRHYLWQPTKKSIFYTGVPSIGQTLEFFPHPDSFRWVCSNETTKYTQKTPGKITTQQAVSGHQLSVPSINKKRDLYCPEDLKHMQ